MVTLEARQPAIRLFGRMIEVQRAPNDDVLALCYSAGSDSFQTASSSSSSSSDSNKNPASTKSSEEERHKELKKQMKKQSKLLLACPRCNSGATKFCYFNNHNTKQPRHFCKGCQRYWTAGGSMRSMAVGAGRRKHKKSAALTNSPSWPSCVVYDGSQGAAATTSVQSFSPIWPNVSCGFFPVPVYVATAGPYWGWVNPREQLKSSSSSVR